VPLPQVGGDPTSWRLWADENAAGAVQTRYVGGDQANEWLARVGAGAGVRWLLSDHEGSIRLVTDAACSVLDTISYDAFGNITSETDPDQGGKLKAQGGVLDVATGLEHYDDRDLSTVTQQWVTQDPLGLKPDSNPRRFVNNAPTDGTDPSGLERIALEGKDVYWVVQHDGLLWSTDDRWIYLGQYASLKVQLSKQFGGRTVDYSDLYNLARYYWRDYADMSGKPRSVQVGLVGAALERVVEHRGNPITTPSAAYQVTSAAAQGLGHGAVIVGNELTFGLIPGLDQNAKDLIQANGGLYQWSQLCGQVARESLTTAATLGGGSAFQAAGRVAGKVPALAKMGQALTKGVQVAGKAIPPQVGEAAAWVACKIVAPAAGVLKVEQTAEQVAKVGQALVNAYALAQEGRDVEAARALTQAGFGSIGLKQGLKDSAKILSVLKEQGPIGLYNFLKACFAAGTPLLTPDGSKLIEEIRPGDLVLSRDENDPDGPVLAKLVQEVYVRTGRIWHLRVRGRLIRTTGEHPFFVVRLWQFAELSEAEPGDLLLSLDGQLIRVEEVYDTGEYETVYNLQVADFHTYFVGAPEWGFSVWAHNESCQTREMRTILRNENKLDPKTDKWLDNIWQRKFKAGKTAEGERAIRERFKDNPDLADKLIAAAKAPGAAKNARAKDPRRAASANAARAKGSAFEPRARAALEARHETVINSQEMQGPIPRGFDSLSYTGTGNQAKLYINDAKDYQGAVKERAFSAFGLSGKKGRPGANPPDTLKKSMDIAERAIKEQVKDDLTQRILLQQLREKTATVRIIGPGTASIDDATRAAVKAKTGFTVSPDILRVD
jgi:RHS repeat-associated protein